MTSYRRNQSLFKPLAVDTPQMRAAVNLVMAVKDGSAPDTASLNIIADAFLEVFGGRNPKDIFGGALGLVPTPGRQAGYGFTSADIVSAVIEIERRKLAPAKGALSGAKRNALKSFVDIGGGDIRDALRSVDRDWKAGRATVELLTDSELADLVLVYETSDNN